MTDRRVHIAIAVSLVLFAVVAVLASCQPADTEEGTEPDTLAAAADTVAAAEPGVFEVTAVDYAFESATEIPSGWTRIRMDNAGQEPHFMSLWKLPEGTTYEEYLAEVPAAFAIGYDSLVAGTVDAAGAGQLIGANLPEWYAGVKPMGGPGMLTAGHTGVTTVNLEPGTYVMECYVKTADGRFHGELGMIKELTVTSDSTGMAEPGADLEMTLTNTSIGADGPVSAGEHTIAVHYEEHPQGLGNDVHVARLDSATDLSEVAAWMDWMNQEGFMPPAPAEFLGGAQEMPVGATSYFTVTLEPGRYAWVSEATTADRLVEEFTVE